MNKLLIFLLLSNYIYSIDKIIYRKYILEDTTVFYPIEKDIPFRYTDQDICEILFSNDINDCIVTNEGSPSPELQPDSK